MVEQVFSTVEQFTFRCGRFWLVGIGLHSSIRVLRGQKAAKFAVEGPCRNQGESYARISNGILVDRDGGIWQAAGFSYPFRDASASWPTTEEYQLWQS